MSAGKHFAATVFVSLLFAGCASEGARPPAVATAASPTTAAAAAAEVRATEQAFAKTMADRDLAGFMRYVSSEAIFFGEDSVQHGAAEVEAAWKPYFVKPAAPFAWAPDHVEALPSGTLALSTGPVSVAGKVVGRFNSIWRLEAPHTWRIVFDKGEAVCAAPH